jgi:hypothetical protein
VQRKPSDKLSMAKRHFFLHRLLLVIFIAKGDGVCINSLDTMIADGNFVRVPS